MTSELMAAVYSLQQKHLRKCTHRKRSFVSAEGSSESPQSDTFLQKKHTSQHLQTFLEMPL